MTRDPISDEALALIAGHAASESQITATEARQRFFQLLDQVAADNSTVVYVDHKDLPLRAAIVSEAYVDYVHRLEQLVGALVEKTSVPFSLVGSATAHGNIEQALAELRTAGSAQGDLTSTRFNDL